MSSRLYFAVRDQWWRTVPLAILNRSREETPTGFVVDIEAMSQWPSHPLRVRLRYVADGSELSARFRAQAGGSFTYHRIGFCLLLPADGFRGQPATTLRSGVATAFEFPTTIVTRDYVDPPTERFHRPFDRLETRLVSGRPVGYHFDGEEFEFEDQRNWTDASYKAYSTRPAIDWPLSTAEGVVFAQTVTIHIGSSPRPVDSGSPLAPEIRVGRPVGVMPSIGLYDGRISSRSWRPGGGFQEFNAASHRGGAPTGYDSIELAVNGGVHAADDDSVQESTAMHGAIVAQARAISPGSPVRLAPVSFGDIAGDWRDGAGDYAPHPPAGPASVRLTGTFGATWAVASAARAVPAGPDLLRYFDSTLPPDCPAAVAVTKLGSLVGRPVLAVSAPAPLAVLVVGLTDRVTMAVANPGPDRVRFRLPDGRTQSLDGFASAWFDQPLPRRFRF